MTCSHGIADLLEESSSLSHSIVSLYFFALVTEEGFLISSWYSLELCLVKAMVFPVVMYGCESWTVKKAERQKLMLLNCAVGEDS